MRRPDDYPLGLAYDEMFAASGETRAHYQLLHTRIQTLGALELADRQQTLERSFLLQGITFTVYGGGEAAGERIIPTDLFPRILSATEWAKIEKGLIQRLKALNLFLADIYGEQKIIADRIVPRDLILGAPSYRRQMQHLYVPHNAYVNVCGSDLIRGEDGEFFVLEDNLRVPSGVSYMLANREAARRTFPGTFRQAEASSRWSVIQTCCWPRSRAWPGTGGPIPGRRAHTSVYSSAYYEHAYLARLMGVPLVEGRDLAVHDDLVYMRTTAGLRRVDVIYRRVDDDFIDPLSFRRDSSLGVAGMFNAYRSGNVVICNAPAPASPTIRRSTPTCRRSSNTTWRTPSSPTSNLPVPGPGGAEPRPGQPSTSS